MPEPRWPAIAGPLVMLLLLAGVSAACAERPSHHDPPSAVRPQDTAQCGTVTATSTAELTDITHGRHDTFDRIVLAFAGPEPACSASYVNHIVADGSGEPISLRGSVFLQVTLRGAAAHDDAGKLTYNGPGTIDTPELKNITAVTLAGDFEGYVTIGLGMATRTHYNVFALSGPTRIVIDVGH
jgi:hypothetical protein